MRWLGDEATVGIELLSVEAAAGLAGNVCAEFLSALAGAVKSAEQQRSAARRLRDP